MQSLHQFWIRRARRARSCALLVVTTVLAACGGGASDTEDPDIDFGSGQKPDAVVVDYPIAYVKRPASIEPMDPDLRQLIGEPTGGDLFLRDRASPTAVDRNLTIALTSGEGDVRDLEPSYDGTKLLFALRLPLLENVDEEDQPTWNIYEYDLPTASLRRVIASDIIAEQGHDLAPHYLPDGRIVFSSTRQRSSRAVLLDEGKPQFAAQDEDRGEPAFVLHVMNADGTDVRQISFNQSHDFDPAVLDDGRIVFSRWDNASGVDEVNLYRMNPDGSGLELLYGAESHLPTGATVARQFLDPRPLPDGRVLALVRPYSGSDGGGDLQAIDVVNYLNDTQPNASNIGVLSGPAQSPITVNSVRVESGISSGGRYAAAFPLRDGTNRLLVSWTQCRLLEGTRIVPCTEDRLMNPAAQAAAPLWGVWVYDPRDRTQQPVVTPTEGILIEDVVALQPQPLPPVILERPPGSSLESDLVAEGVGVIDIRSVYDLDGADIAPGGIRALADPRVATAAQRPARFLRIEKAVGLPDDEVLEIPGSAFGVSALHGMREILGYAPVEPDGSVRIKVPAGVPFAISVLDANGRRISPRHRNWLQVKPGQTLTCNGCHDPASGRSHGRADAFAPVYSGSTTVGVPFPATQAAFFADFGETMAQVRARVSCQTDCAALSPSVDVAYEDVWTDPVAAGRAADASFALAYADLATPAPTTEECQTRWTPLCRIVVHYEAHLHPLWSLPRVQLAADGVTVLTDDTCTSCHTPRNAANAARVPAGQLDLGDGASAVAGQLNAYRELLTGGVEQELVMGALQDRLVQTGIDPVTGQPILSTVPVPAPMSAAGARASVRFFTVFATGGSHAGRLTPAELRLVSEWLDLGAQYFNDPFAVPVD